MRRKMTGAEKERFKEYFTNLDVETRYSKWRTNH